MCSPSHRTVIDDIVRPYYIIYGTVQSAVPSGLDFEAAGHYVNLVMYRLPHEKKITGLPQI